MHLHPQGGENFFSGLIYRKMCKCTPQLKQESIFRPVYARWLRLEVYLDAILRATAKKRSSTFLGKKCTPQTKSWLRLCRVHWHVCVCVIQDDYIDCFGDPELTGKVGTDIEDNKCSWMIVQALARASDEQRAILEVRVESIC